MTLLEELVIDRVDLCDVGANSEAYIELFKRKDNAMDTNKVTDEPKKPEATPEVKPEATPEVKPEVKPEDKPEVKPEATDKEQTEKIFSLEAELAEARAELAEAKATLEALQSMQWLGGAECDKAENKLSFDSTETLKSLPKEVREYFELLKAQKEAAETALAKSIDEAKEVKAIEKANTLKAIPIEQDKLVGIIKSASPEIMELLDAVNTAIATTTLNEVGKSTSSEQTPNTAWGKIEAKAQALAIEKKISVAKAVSQVVNENPELYREYIEGGAN